MCEKCLIRTAKQHCSQFMFHFLLDSQTFELEAIWVLSPPSWLLVNMNFQWNDCGLCEVLTIPIKIGEDWSSDKGMPTGFRTRDSCGRRLELRLTCIFDVTVAFYGGFSTFPSNLKMTSPLMKEQQSIFQIEDGGVRHLELRYVCIFSGTVAFHAIFLLFLTNLWRIGPIVNEKSDFLNSKWRRPTSWFLWICNICIFIISVVFLSDSQQSHQYWKWLVQ